MPRLAGFKGAVYLDTGQANPTNRIADLYNVTLEVEQETAECGIVLEAFEKYQQGRLRGRITGERYITDTPTATGGLTPANLPAADADLRGGSVMAAQVIFLAPNSGNHYIGNQVKWKILTIGAQFTGTGAGFSVTGTGWLERVTQQGPRGDCSEVWEIRITDAVPVFAN